MAIEEFDHDKDEDADVDNVDRFLCAARVAHQLPVFGYVGGPEQTFGLCTRLDSIVCMI